jgi:hypothetical protein
VHALRGLAQSVPASRRAQPMKPPRLRLASPETILRAALFTCLVMAGCHLGGGLSGDTYRDGLVAYRIGNLPSEWRRVQVTEGQLAFHHAGGGTIVANGSCEPREDVSLDVLTNHLLFGIEDRREQSRIRFDLDGRAALRTRLAGTLDGVPVALDLVVLKKDGCTYDLGLAASPAVYPLRQPDFERFFRGFAGLRSV